MLVGQAPDQPLPLERIEPVEGGLVRRDLTAELDFADEGGAAILAEIPEQKFEYRLLLLCQNTGGQVVTGVCDMGINRIEMLLSLL